MLSAQLPSLDGPAGGALDCSRPACAMQHLQQGSQFTTLASSLGQGHCEGEMQADGTGKAACKVCPKAPFTFL